MKKKYTNDLKGFSLIETVIYVAILALVSVVVINALLIMSRSFIQFSMSRDIQTGATVSIERMIRDIKLADSVDVAGSTFGSSPGILSLNTKDRDTGDPVIIKFYVSGDTLVIKEGASQEAPLLSDKVQVNNLLFNNINTTNTEAVKIELELENSTSNSTVSKKFYTTAELRNSY